MWQFRSLSEIEYLISSPHIKVWIFIHFLSQLIIAWTLLFYKIHTKSPFFSSFSRSHNHEKVSAHAHQARRLCAIVVQSRDSENAQSNLEIVWNTYMQQCNNVKAINSIIMNLNHMTFNQSHFLLGSHDWAYISDLLDDKVFRLVVDAAGENILVLPGTVPHQVVTVHLALTFC